MAYTPTKWVSGTIISASKLNNIERGVESVNTQYTPTTWAEGDTVTAAKLNKIEQGIANASGDFSTAQVTVNKSGGVCQMYLPIINYTDFGDDEIECILPGPFLSVSTKTCTVPLYKGIARAGFPTNVTVTGVTGGAEVSDYEEIKITGDCTITIEVETS